MSIYGWFTGRGPSGFGYSSTASEVLAGAGLSGKTFLVTGSNTGLGAETVRALASAGARVIATARTLEKAEESRRALSGAVVPLALELSAPSSIRSAVEAVRAMGSPLDGIVCNAGIMALPTRTLLHGYEAQFFTNHVGHFQLVTGLLDRLSPAGRVVMVASEAHHNAWSEGIRLDDLAAEKAYSPWAAYGQSKLANILFARELAKRLPPGQTANSVHPGVIATRLVRHMNPVLQALWIYGGPILFAKTIPQGAATSCYVVAHPAAAAITGEYWDDCNVSRSSAAGRDDALARALWEKTEAIASSLGDA